jgi:hypothetical protein
VAYFLTRSREGYCDLFASAMAVMCRIAGVPSRLVTGYTEGAYDRERESWRVTEQDAHAWPEVFLPGAGWTAFEPTPAAAPVASEAARRRLQWLVPVLSALLVAVGLLWLAALRLRSPRGEHLPGVTFTGERRAVIETYLACCRLLSRLGFTRPRSRTAGEYLAAITSRAPALGLPELVPPLRRLTQLFTLARYSPAEITPQDTRSAQEDLAGLRAGYRRLARAARVSRRRH